MGVQQKLMRHAQVSTTMDIYGSHRIEALGQQQGCANDAGLGAAGRKPEGCALLGSSF